MQSVAVVAWEESHLGVSSQESLFGELVCAVGATLSEGVKKIIQRGQDSN